MGKVITDGDDLFDDITGIGQEDTPTTGLEGSDGDLPNSNPGATPPEPPEPPAEPGNTDTPPTPNDLPDDLKDVRLTGTEKFLSGYGIKGGIIEFEEGDNKHFSELSPEEQNNVLTSLTRDSIPSVDEMYNLSESEIALINEYRGSDSETIHDYLNNVLDTRLDAIHDGEKYSKIDYDSFDADDIYVYHLKKTNPDMSDEELADELVKARELSTYDSTTMALKEGMKTDQKNYITEMRGVEDETFNEEVEAQRHAVVDSIVDIDDIAGAKINTEMKEYLLGDIMELNDNKDPVLMEKIFSDPTTMFKVNWFLNYGEDHIKQINEYWKGEVSKARKAGYDGVVRNMPGTPVPSNIPARATRHTATMGDAERGVVGEEELFDDI